MMEKLLNSSLKELEEIPVDKIVNTGIGALTSYPDKVQVFQFLLNVVPKTIDVSMLDDCVFQLVLPEVHKFIKECIEDASTSSIKNICNLKSISSTVKLLHYLLSQLSKTSLQEISTLVLSTLEVLQTIYAFCKLSCTNEQDIDIVDAFKTLFSDCQRLQTSLLAVIIPQNMKQCDERYTDFIIKLMNNLCNTVAEITALDVRSTAEIWKSVIKMSTENAKILIEKHDLNYDCFGWLSKAAKFLSSEILHTVDQMVGKHSCDSGDIERQFKIISFYVKLLLRFLSDYNDTLWDQKNVFDALIGLTRCFYVLEDTLSKTANILLTNDIQNLLFAFSYINQLLKFLSAEFTDNTALPRLIICIHLIERIMADIKDDVNSIYLDTNFSILQVIAKCILNGAVEEIRIDCCAIYSKLVASITALIVCVCRQDANRNDFFEDFLIPLMLQSDLLLIVLAIDVFTLWARYQTPKQCLEYLIFWSNIAEKYPITSYRMSDFFVKILIQNLYDTLDSQLKEQFILAKPVERNLKAWMVLGIRWNSLVSSKCVQDAERALEMCFTQRSSVSYYSMIDHLSLLSSGNQLQSAAPVNILLKWIAMDEPNIFSALSIAFLRLACRCVLSFEHIHKILTKISRMYERKLLRSNIKIEILNCLCTISKLHFRFNDEYSVDCFRLISSLIGKLYRDDDVMVSEECVVAMLLASNNPIFAHSLKDEVQLKSEIADSLKCLSSSANIRYDLSKWLTRKVHYEHKCDTQIRNDSSIAVRGNEKTRLILGFDFEFDEAVELTNNLQRITNALVELHRVRGLSHDIIDSIGKIGNTLTKFK